MRHRPLLAGAVVLALAISLAACGDDGDEDTADTTTTTEAEASGDETTTEATTEDPAEEETTTEAETDDTAAEGDAEDLTGLLLTPEDLGEGFVEQTYETSTEAGPCGTAIDEENPFDAIVGAVLLDAERQLLLQHELRTYADEDTASATFAAAQEALSCGAETAQPGLVLGDVTDVSADVGAEAFVVALTAEEQGLEGGIIVVQVGNVLSVYQLQGPIDVEDGPDPLAIVSANVEALQAELG